jgi:hypothetical protein
MYNPLLGRFMQDDPLGFDAGDTNLYRFEGDNPVDRADPSGLIGILFDGSGYKLLDNSIISSIYRPYLAGEGKLLRDGQHIKTDLGDLWKKVNGAEDLIEKALKANPNEPVDIIGWSRGGMAALALAKKLEQHRPPIKIRFLGLVDPTAPVKKFTEDKQFLNLDLRNCGVNVQNAALIVRDGKHDGNLAKHQFYRVFFQVKEVKFDKNTNIILNKTVPIGHLETGFSKEVGEGMWEAARKAGVNLPPLKDSPFAAKDYDEKPRGGRGGLGILEKLVRELRLLGYILDQFED